MIPGGMGMGGLGDLGSDRSFMFMVGVIDAVTQPIKTMKKAWGALGEKAKDAIAGMADAATTATGTMLSALGSVTSFLSSDAFLKPATDIFNNIWNSMSTLADRYIGLGRYVEQGSAGWKDATKVFSDLEWQIGLSEDQAREMVNLGQKWGMAGEDLSTWGKTAAQFALATGASSESVGTLYIQMGKFRNISMANIGRVSNGLREIGDRTAITADQMISFQQGMSEFFLRMPGLTGKAASDLTINLGKMAGKFADVFGDPAQIGEMITKTMDPLSPEGKKIAHMIGRLGGMSTRAAMETIRTAPEQAMDAMYRGLAQMDEKQFQLRARMLQSQLGVDFQTLAKMRLLGKKSLNMQLSDQEEAQLKTARRATRMVNWQKKQQESFKLQMARLWASVGAPLVKFVMAVAKPLIQSLGKIATVVNKRMQAAGKTFKDFGTYIGEKIAQKVTWLIDYIDDNWDNIVKGFQKAVEILKGFWETIKRIASGDILGALSDHVWKIAGGIAAWKFGGALLGQVGKLGGLMGGLGKSMGLGATSLGAAAGALTAAIAAGVAAGVWAGGIKTGTGETVVERIGSGRMTSKQRMKTFGATMEEFRAGQVRAAAKGQEWTLSQHLSGGIRSLSEQALKTYAYAAEQLYDPKKLAESGYTAVQLQDMMAKSLKKIEETTLVNTGERDMILKNAEFYRKQLEFESQKRDQEYKEDRAVTNETLDTTKTMVKILAKQFGIQIEQTKASKDINNTLNRRRPRQNNPAFVVYQAGE